MAKAEETKTVKKATTVKAVETEVVTKATNKASVSVSVVDTEGKAAGKISLPEVMFGAKVNKTLIAQAVRVYLANQRQGNASTKTRGEVDGSSRKIYRQKGTGRARHGTVRAPIFVKGGIVFGPKPRDFGLSMPKKMRKQALYSALSAKVVDNALLVVSGLNDLTPKTKAFAEMLKKLSVYDKKQKLLFVLPADSANARRAGQNIPGVSFISATQVNTYELLNAKQVIVSKEAVDVMKDHFLGKDK